MFHNFPFRIHPRRSKITFLAGILVFSPLAKGRKYYFLPMLFINTWFALVKTFLSFSSHFFRIHSSAHEYTQLIVSNNHTIFIKQKQACRFCVHVLVVFFSLNFGFQFSSRCLSLTSSVTDDIVYTFSMKSAYALSYSSLTWYSHVIPLKCGREK